eukprot:399817-Amorphochlora_amoeboformis.AAC.1
MLAMRMLFIAYESTCIGRMSECIAAEYSRWYTNGILKKLVVWTPVGDLNPSPPKKTMPSRGSEYKPYLNPSINQSLSLA